MAPRRADYKTRKEYRWAKKVEQREHIANAPSIPGAVIVSCGVWLGVVVIGSLVAGGAGGGIGVLVGVVVAVVFYRKYGAKINKAWNTKEIAERRRDRRP